jgi:hypothetical protein
VLTERCEEVCQSVCRLETDDIEVSCGYETAINSVLLAGKASARLATSFLLPVENPFCISTREGF